MSVDRNCQVMVLGMHRSGTSVLTALLRQSGLWAGREEDFPPADDHNQEGYWEHRGVWSADEGVLRALGASWSEVADLDLSRLDATARDRFRERAREVVRELGRHGSWVVKDPRLCLLFPLWREVLERPVCVLIHRDPLPVARSLAARDGIPVPHGIALWEKYAREALAATLGVPRVLVSHRELMADPAATLDRLHRDLARLGGPDLRVLDAEEIRAIVNPSLVHHPRDPGAERAYLTPPQLDLLDALANGSALGLDPVPPLSAGARDLLASHQSSQGERLAARILAGDLQRALSWVEELDAIVSAILESRSWRIGRALTSMLGCLRGGAGISASERRDRLMSEVRRQHDAGE